MKFEDKELKTLKNGMMHRQKSIAVAHYPKMDRSYFKEKNWFSNSFFYFIYGQSRSEE